VAEQRTTAGEGEHQDATRPAGATEAGVAQSTRPDTERPKETRRSAKKGESGERAAAGPRAGKSRGQGVATLRTRVAQLVWLLFVVAALFLAVGALCVALGANKDNSAVHFVLQGAKFFDLDIFSRSNGIKTFGGDNAATKSALFNWGIAAVLYLVVGRILERIIRP
jgi:hypothetical protein